MNVLYFYQFEVRWPPSLSAIRNQFYFGAISEWKMATRSRIKNVQPQPAQPHKNYGYGTTAASIRLPKYDIIFGGDNQINTVHLN